MWDRSTQRATLSSSHTTSNQYIPFKLTDTLAAKPYGYLYRTAYSHAGGFECQPQLAVHLIEHTDDFMRDLFVF